MEVEATEGEEAMSIQRYVPLGGDNIPNPNGEYVIYADHVAEVERVHSHYSDASALWGDGYDHGAEAMRAACIAAVEALPDDPQGWHGIMQHGLDRVLAALREVQS
jgi:signal peptidase I